MSKTKAKTSSSPHLLTKNGSQISGSIERAALRKKLKKMPPDQLDEYFNMKLSDEIPEDQFSTGDILLCRGTESFSRMIQKLTRCTFSHVSMIVVDPPSRLKELYGLDPNCSDRVYVWESNNITVDQRNGGGVQLIRLKRWLADCERDCGKEILIVWRKLNCPETFPQIFSWLEDVASASYRGNLLGLFKGAFRFNITEDQSNKMFLCSELIALTYKKLGLLTDDVQANNSHPRDFTSKERADSQDIQLLKGATLSKEVRIRFSKPDYGWLPQASIQMAIQPLDKSIDNAGLISSAIEMVHGRLAEDTTC